MADRRVTVRFREHEYRAVEQWAGAAGITVGGLVRTATIRAGLQVARDASDGKLRLRARSSPSLAAAAHELEEDAGDVGEDERVVAGEGRGGEDGGEGFDVTSVLAAWRGRTEL